jgi:nitroreductase
MNETLKVIAQRYSCRDYKNDMPADDILQAITQAAIQAPSGMNRQPWRVILVKDRAVMQEIESEALSYLANMDDKSAYNRIMERGGRLFYGAPCMIIVPIEKAQYNSSLIDCGILCQNIALAAASLGLASVICGLTQMAFVDGTNSENLMKRLGFPEGYVFGCSVLLGYANSTKAPHDPDKNKIIIIE